MAQAENEYLPEEEKSSSEEIALINKRWGLVIIAPESAPRMKTSSTGLGRGLGRWFDARMTTFEIQLRRTSIAEI